MTWQAAAFQLTHDFSALPFRYQELCQVVKLTPSLSGGNVRLKLTNSYGKQALRFDQVTIADQLQFSQGQDVTASGQQEVVIPPGQVVITDPLAFKIRCGQPYYIKMVAHRPQTYADFALTYHPRLTNAALSRHADFQPSLSERMSNRKGWFSLEAMEVYTSSTVQQVELTGDSLMESGMVTAPLITYFNQHYPDQITWLQTGISGNQLLQDAPQEEPLYATFGHSLLHRYSKEHFFTNVTVALIGTNDLIMPFYSSSIADSHVTPDDMLHGYQRLKTLCEHHHSQLLTATLTPVRLFDLTNLQVSEQLIQQRRSQINALLLRQAGVVDVAKVLTDPQTQQLASWYDFGDHLHWNALGGHEVAHLLIPYLQSRLQL